MCLITSQTEPEILESDLRFYKILRKDEDGCKDVFNSVYINSRSSYQIGVMYEAYDCKAFSNSKFGEFDTDISPFDNVADMSYYQKKEYIGTTHEWRKVFEESALVSIGVGIHGATTVERLAYNIRRRGQVIVEMLAPAGAKVFYDNTGLLAVDKATPVLIVEE